MTAVHRVSASALIGGLLAVLLDIDSAHSECGTWDLSGTWKFFHSNGYVVDFELREAGGKITGSGEYHVKAGARVISGFLIPTKTFGGWVRGPIVAGALTRNILSFTIDWNSDPIGEYAGSIDENGFISGLTYDRANPNETANWSTYRPARCLVAKAVDPVSPKKLVPRSRVTVNKPAPKSLGEPLGPSLDPIATVTGDVDLYDVPGGVGNVIGMLERGTRVSATCREDRWCNVRGDMPNGQGWVWGDFLAF